MSDLNINVNDDEFEKLLNCFVNAEFDEDEDSEEHVLDNENHEENIAKTKETIENVKEEISEQKEQEEISRYIDEYDDDKVEELSAEDEQTAQEILENNVNDTLFQSISDAKKKIDEDEKQVSLGQDESELAQAFVNYSSAIDRLSKKFLNQPFECDFEIEDLYPNYRPSMGKILSDDLVKGWLLMVKMFPKELTNFPLNSTDEQFLNFAEKLENQDLQLAVISYVEILIDLEGCELSYEAKLAKYQEKHIKRIMYEEYLARKERQKKFINAVKAKNFPIDAEQLIVNYFKISQKDVDGAFKALTTNPAMFSPIDFKKIKPRLFGLIKVSPKDGIKMNIKIGNFLKKLKV